ncbi:MAG: C39 family peptidase [Anaerolineae bacterium]|nr:C39 family peptidase [Anaerolineae bacterium]
MSKHFLPVPHRIEAFAGGCLPACCQMALAYCGISKTQTFIASKLKYIAGVGTPARNIVFLDSLGVSVMWYETGSLKALQQALAEYMVPVVFVRTGELPYWELDTPHTVVVVAIDIETVYVNDPAFDTVPISVPVGDFQLAWDEFEGQWAAIQCL